MASVATKVRVNTARFEGVDALRGFIMMVMVIDHANAYVARQHSSEFWAGAMTSYQSAFAFLTRAITHLCAPGFFFLMGAGIYWFSQARREMGWSESQISKRLAWRGLAIFLVGNFIENPILFIQSFLKPATESLSTTSQPPPIDGTALYWGLIVLSGLGMVMMLCSILLRFGVRVWAAAGLAAVFATNALLPASGKVGPIWETILLAPGLSRHLIVMYPLIPWFGVSAFGMCLGYWWRAKGDAAPRLLPAIGLGLLLLGLALRVAGGFGNIRLPRDGGWIEFLNMVKYPPSLVFWTTFVGADLLILALLIRLPQVFRSPRSPLVVFGQTPLFFYVAHLYLLAIVGFTLFREAAPLWVIYPVWLCVLAVLYPLCLWYRRFKMSKPVESVWRMF